MANDKSTEEPDKKPELEEVPPVEEVKEEVKQVEEPTPESSEESAPVEEPKEETPEEQPEMSRRERLRVQDLLNKYPDLADRQKVQAPNFRDKVQADEDVYKTLEDTTRDYGQGLLDQATSQVEFSTWRRFLTAEDKQVRSSYPELDKSSKDFYPALADALNVKYLRTVGYNPGNPEKGVQPSVQHPDISYQDFVDSEMEFANELASIKASDTQKNIAKQAANTGIRPSGGRTKGLDLTKAPEKMSDEELKAVLAQAGL